MNSQNQPPAAGEAAHTPYRLHYSPMLIGGGYFAVLDAAGNVVTRSSVVSEDPQDYADAKTTYAFIVRACNSHEIVCSLLARCEAVADENLAREIRETLRQVRGA